MRLSTDQRNRILLLLGCLTAHHRSIDLWTLDRLDASQLIIRLELELDATLTPEDDTMPAAKRRRR